jgi:hypothetical protein
MFMYDPKIMQGSAFGFAGLVVGYLIGRKYKDGKHAIKIAGMVGGLAFAVGYLTSKGEQKPLTIVTKKEQITE